MAALRVCASWRPGVSQAGQPICAQSLLCTQQSCALPGPAGSPPAVLFPPALTPNAKAQVRRGPLTAQARKPPSQAGGSGRLGTDAVVCLRRCPKMVPSHARSWEGALRISAPSSWRPLLGKHCLGELTNRGHLSLAPLPVCPTSLCTRPTRSHISGRPAVSAQVSSTGRSLSTWQQRDTSVPTFSTWKLTLFKCQHVFHLNFSMEIFPNALNHTAFLSRSSALAWTCPVGCGALSGHWLSGAPAQGVAPRRCPGLLRRPGSLPSGPRPAVAHGSQAGPERPPTEGLAPAVPVARALPTRPMSC